MRVNRQKFGIFCIALTLSTAGAVGSGNALTADLARSCRNQALKTYPYQLPGTGAGNARAEREYYKACVSRNGVMPPPQVKTDGAPH